MHCPPTSRDFLAGDPLSTRVVGLGAELADKVISHRRITARNSRKLLISIEKVLL